MKRTISVLLIAMILTTMLPITQVQALAKTAAQYLADGNKLLTQNKYPDALKAFDAAIKLNAKYTEAYVGKGRALAGSKKYADAVKAYDKAISLNKKHAPAYYYKGIALAELDKYTDAIKAFDAAIVQNPKHAEAYNQKGLVLYWTDKYADAIKCFDIAVKTNAKLADAYLNKAIVLYRGLEKYAEANTVIDSALKLKLNTTSVYYHKGIILSNLDKFKEAVTYFDKAIKLEPKVSLSYLEKGIALYSLGSYSEALAAFHKAYELPPFLSSVHYYRGMTYNALGKYKEAIADLNEAIRRNKDMAYVLVGENNKGLYYNEYLNMALEAPQNWVVQDNDTVSMLFENLLNIPAGEDSNAALSELLTFMVSKYPLGSPVPSNPNLSMSMENTVLYDGIARGSDYLYFVRKNIEQAISGYTFEDKTEAVVLNGVSFDTLKATYSINGMTINQKFYSTVYKGFAVTLTLSYMNEAELQELEAIIATIDFGNK